MGVVSNRRHRSWHDCGHPIIVVREAPSFKSCYHRKPISFNQGDFDGEKRQGILTTEIGRERVTCS